MTLLRALVVSSFRTNRWAEEVRAALVAQGYRTAHLRLRTFGALGKRLRERGSDLVERHHAARLRVRLGRAPPALVVVINPFFVPAGVLAELAGLACPVLGWMGDRFAHLAGRAPAVRAALDRLYCTDRTFLAEAAALGIEARYLPHAAPGHLLARPARSRRPSMVFVGSRTPEREALLGAIDGPLRVVGRHWRGWRPPPGPVEVVGRNIGPRALARAYAGHLCTVNVRNRRNVEAGLNQRSFEAPACGCLVLHDPVADLEGCFEPGREVLVYEDAAELNEHYARLRREPALAAALAERARRRVAASHTYRARLRAMLAGIAD